MLKLLRRISRYFSAAGNSKFNELADPKIQLEQAIAESQDQHRRLKEQAANVIANQKQSEMRLNRSMEDMEKLNASARQAVQMADEAQKRGDTAKATEYTRAAEAFANRLIAREREVESQKQMVLQAVQAADQARHAVAQNSTALQQRLSERQRLMGQLDQAKMQETVNKAMASLTETVGEDVPTLDEVRDKIEARYAKAVGANELQSSTVEGRMMEIEQATADTEAQHRLEQIRAQLGIGAGSTAPGSSQDDAPGQGTASPGV